MICTPYAAAAALLADLLVELGNTRGKAPERQAVYPHAEPAIEFCSMVWVGFRGLKPMDQQRHCGVWVADLTVGIQRCYPVESDGGAPPAVFVDSAARDILDDAEAVRRAIAEAFEDEQHTVTGWRPVNPMGGSHGSRTDVSVAVAMGQYTEPLSAMLPGDPRS